MLRIILCNVIYYPNYLSLCNCGGILQWMSRIANLLGKSKINCSTPPTEYLSNDDKCLYFLYSWLLSPAPPQLVQGVRHRGYCLSIITALWYLFLLTLFLFPSMDPSMGCSSCQGKSIPACSALQAAVPSGYLAVWSPPQAAVWISTLVLSSPGAAGKSLIQHLEHLFPFLLTLFADLLLTIFSFAPHCLCSILHFLVFSEVTSYTRGSAMTWGGFTGASWDQLCLAWGSTCLFSQRSPLEALCYQHLDTCTQYRHIT